MARYRESFLCLGHGPPPRPPPFDAFPPPSGSSEVFDYGHGEPAGEAYDRHSQNMEPEDFWPDRDEDMRVRGGGWDRDRDLRHERNMISDNFDRDGRPPFPDIHERGGWPEHRERDFPGNFSISHLNLSGGECLLLVLCLLGRFKCLTSPFLSLLSLFFQLSISFHHHPGECSA